MKILILGATGRTGRHLLNEALQKGHTVHALVRDRSKLQHTSPDLVLFEGNPSDISSLSRAARGCDAILSTLNISRNSDFPWAGLRTPPNFLSEVMRKIINI